MTTFKHRGLSKKLDDFLKKEDFPSLYKSYAWEWDKHSDGFPDIYRLESLLKGHLDNDGTIQLDDIYKVARWGGMGSGRARGISIEYEPVFKILNMKLSKIRGHGDDLVWGPEDIALLLRESTKGLGPTFASKVLRFVLPEHYGAVDTRCVGAFGNWTELRLNQEGSAIAENGWPEGYGTWINILRYFAQSLNAQPVECPHPENFILT